MKIGEVKELENMAKEVRKGIIEAVYNAQSGHPGGRIKY